MVDIYWVTLSLLILGSMTVGYLIRDIGLKMRREKMRKERREQDLAILRGEAESKS